MTEISDSEIDVEQLMMEIREAVAKREASGVGSLISASLGLYDRLLMAQESPAQPVDLPPLKLQAEFVPGKENRYHVNDLLKYHDQTFIWNAYRAILKREPDEHGLTQFLQSLRSGRLNKIDVLASLRFSPEGKRSGVELDGLARPALLRKLYRVPALGYLLEMLVGILRLPAMIRSQRQFEGHALAQQELLADQINQLSHHTFQFSGSFAREVAATTEAQRSFAELQRQQVVGLFREQLELLRRLRKTEAEIKARLGSAKQATGGQPNASPRPITPPARSDEEQRALDELLASFVEEFRGERGKIKEGLRVYLPLLKGAGVTENILDLGCGRGEWLELLGEEGLRGRGVESNRVMVERARGAGLDVVEHDALAYLRDRPANSFDAITAFHFIEHLPFDALLELLDEIERTLKPGAVVILETPNPKNLVVAACNFHSDPTHYKPIFPETLRFLLGQKGFVELSIEYLNPVEGSPFGDGVPSSRALHGWFYGPRDYAMIGRKVGRIPAVAKEKAAQMSLPVRIGDQVEAVRLEQSVSRQGHRFYARPLTDDYTIFEDVVDSNEYALPIKFDRQDVLIDVGAHIGSFSYAALNRGAGKVYAYEAHPVNHAIARKNLERFGARAECRNLAVWRSDVPSQTLFNDRLNNKSGPNTGGLAVVYNDDGLPVQTVGLDDILREATGGFKGKVRLLKIDCEGAEYPILFSAKHLNVVEEICGEYHEIDPEVVPERARVEGMPDRLDSHALKNFLEGAGWFVEINPVSADGRLGHFSARPKKSSSGPAG
jgi:O-antigen chain-terminating methyltransferase